MSPERKRHRHSKKENHIREKQPPYSQFDRYLNRVLKAPTIDSSVEAATDLVRYATEETYDCYHVLKATKTGLELLYDKGRREAGKTILDRIESYFSGDEILAKRVIPWGMESTEGNNRERVLLDLRRLVDDIFELNSAYPYRFKVNKTPLTFNTQHFLRAVKSAIETVNNDTKANPSIETILLQIRPEALRSDINSNANEINSINELRKMTLRTIDMKLDENNLEVPETVLFELLSLDIGDHPYSITGRKYQGVSLRDIFNESDITKRLIKLMDFMSSLPKGDIFWKRLLEATFLKYQVHIKNPTFKHPEISEFVFINQWYLAESFYFTLLKEKEEEGIKPDYGLDEGFNRLLKNLNTDLTENFLKSLRIALQTTPMTMSFLRDVSLAEMLRQFPETTLLVVHYKKTTEGETGYRQLLKGNRPQAFLLDELIPWYLRTYASELTESWRKRFGLPFDRSALLVNHLKHVAFSEKEVTEMLTDDLVTSLERRLGIIFFQKLAKKEEEISKTSDRLTDYFKNDRRLKYWPNSKIPHQIKFDEGSLPKIMGIENIEFIVPNASDSTLEPIVFMMRIIEPRIVLRGEIDPNFDQNSEMKLSVNLQNEYQGLKTLLRTIVVSSFHDLVLRESLRQTVSASPITSEGQDKIDENKSETHMTKKTIPKFIPRVRPATVLEQYEQTGKVETTSSKDLVKEISDLIALREKKPFKPRKVDVYIRALPGAVKYKDAVIRFQEGRATAEEVKKIKEEMFNMSSAKIQSLSLLPESLTNSMETQIDPITSELVFLQTWVVEHESPKPTEEEKASLDKFHERFYKVGSPQLPFLDSLIGLLIDEGNS